MNISLQKGQKGFTLIETLFAILIFSAALVALMSIAGRGISATSSARQQIAAHYLAQEGLEVVRNLRDSNYVVNGAWGNRFADECTETDPCDINYGQMPSNPPDLKPATGDFLEIEELSGFFIGSGLNEGTMSPFLRTIWVEPRHPMDNAQPSEYEVISRVEWESKGVPRVVELRTFLKKWQ